MGTHPIFESDFDCLTEMSFQWQFVAVILYTEIAVSLLLCLPFISSKWWSAFFKSTLAKKAAEHGTTIFYILATILSLLFFDAYKDVAKYSKEDLDSVHDANQANQFRMYMFRAQRNLYISGFALFLWIIISRLAGLLADKARVKAEAVAAKAQAASASKTAELLLDENQKREKEGKAGLDDEVKNEIADLKKRLESAQNRAKEEEKVAKEASDKYEKSQAELVAMKKQSEGLAREFDRVTEELAALQNAAGDGKKDD